MIRIEPQTQSLEELAAMVVRLGRELERAARAVCVGGNSKDFGFVERTLRRCAERDPFNDRDDASLDAVRGILEADLRSEIIGFEDRFFETNYDSFGQNGELRECPIYSDRGDSLLALQTDFERFMDVRARALDRVAAERALLRLLAL